MNRTVLLLGIALLLSLGLNALQWMSAPSSGGSSTTEGSAADSVVVSATNDEPEETGCWVELAECRGDAAEESEELVRVFTHHDRAGGAPAAAPPAVPVEPTPREVGPELEEEVLHAVAVHHLRQAWEASRDETIENLKRSLANEQERSEMRERDLASALQLLSVSDDERASFEEAYRALWEERVADFREALDEDPPDARAAFDVAKSLFEDEDALAAARFGDMGRRRLRVSQAERRTVVLALLAVNAGLEWDETISW